MDRTLLRDWVDAYERAWRAPGIEGLGALFAEDATYSMNPFMLPVVGLPAIHQMWERERSPGEEFTMTSEIVAVESDVGVVRIEVRYKRPHDEVFRELWVVRLAPDGRCTSFEEWPLKPPGSGAHPS